MRAYDLEVTGSLITTGSLKVVGDITAEQYQIKTTVTQVTMSAASGSMIFGDSIDDTHQITGSTTTSGSINVRNGELQVGGTIVPTGTAVSSSFAQKTAVSSSFAQKTAVSSSFAQKSAVSSSFAQKSAVSGSFINNTASSSFVSAASVSGSFVQGASVSGSLGLVAGVDTGTTAISGSAISTGSFGDVALRKGGKVKFSDASYIALSGSSISAPGEGIDMVANNLLALNIDETGAVTKPLQPAFSAQPASTQSDIAISAVTVVFGTERIVSDDFATPNFTAPVTGKYQLQVMINVDNIDTASNYYQVKIITSNRTYDNVGILDPGVLASDPAYWSFAGSILADMDASDTAYVVLEPGANGAAQADIRTDSWFSGYLVC